MSIGCDQWRCVQSDSSATSSTVRLGEAKGENKQMNATQLKYQITSFLDTLPEPKLAVSIQAPAGQPCPAAWLAR